MREKRSLLSLAAVVVLAVIAILLYLRVTSAQTGLEPARPNSVIVFTEHTVTDNFEYASSAYAADIDGDEDVDIVGAARSDDQVTWWENDGNQNFAPHIVDGNFDYARDVYATDLDDDGDVDILGAASNADAITWWENDGHQSFTKHEIGSSDGASSVYAIDLDDDGDVDVLSTGSSADDVIWWENDGEQNFAGHAIDADFDYAICVYATDVDGDGDMDILASAYEADAIAWWENDGDEHFTKHIIDGSYNGAKGIYAADLDGDGDVDVLGAAQWDSNVAWWENDGSEHFTKHVLGGFSRPQKAYAADVDGDGDMDVLAASLGGGISWLENDGNESFTKYTIDGDVSGSSVYAVDLDGDGDVDVLGAGSDEIAWWEQTPTLSISDASVTEGDGGSVNAVFSVTLSITSTQTVTVEYATADGSAVAPSDYTAIPTTTLTFPPGTVTRFMTVSVQGDTVDESGEIFYVNLANPTNAIVGDGQGQGIILDDDGFVVYLPLTLRNIAPPVSPTLDDISNPDGNGSYTVSWSVASGASSYTLQEDDNAAFSSPSTVYDGPGTSKLITNRPIGTYYYRVQASNEWGDSDWSETKSVEVTISPTSTPEPSCPVGSWSGTTDQGYSVSFEVSDTSGCQVDELSIKWRLSCIPSGSLIQQMTFYNVPITNDQFKIETVHYTVTGKFITQYWAGTWQAFSSDFMCEGEGTWEANR